jgi:hypothetical protein
MFKTLLASATAAAIVIGTLAAGTGTASATSYKYSGGHYITKVIYVPKKVCEPVYETVSWYDYYGWHTKEVYAGEKCYTVKVKSFEKVWVPYVAKKIYKKIYKAPAKLYFKSYSY